MKVRLTAAVLALSALPLNAALAADPNTKVTLDLDRQPLEAALVELSKQGHLQLVIATGSLPGRITEALHGNMSLGAALDRLLRDTGLTYKLVGDHTIAIVQSAEPRQTSDPPTLPGASGAPSSDATSIDYGRVDQGAQDTNENSGERVVNHRSVMSRLASLFGLLVTVLSGAAGAQTSADSPGSELREIVVTGSLLQQPSGFTTPTPVTVVGQDLIDARAPSDPGELLKEIPSLKLSSGPGNAGPGGRNQVAQTSVDFYGLGSSRTLTLIDGQRQTGSNSSNQIDIGTIPTLMIERIETITGGASAAYGSDAVGGVANFILRSKIDGVMVNAAVGTTDHRDKNVTSVNLGFGRGIGSRASLVVGIDLSKDTGIDSPYSRDWGRKEPGLFAYGNASAARGAQPAAAFVNGYEQKNNTRGGVITGCTPAPCPATLSGIAFDSSGNPYAFVPGTTTPTSTFMYGTSANYGDDPNGQSSLSTPYKRWTGMAKLNIDLTDDTRLTLRAGYSGVTGEERVDVVRTSTAVSINNPFLPASIRSAMTAAGKTSIAVGRSNVDVGYDYTGQINRLVTAGAELAGKIAGSWSYDAYYKFSQSTSDGWQTGYRPADFAAALSNCTVLTTGGIAAAPGCVGFNPFGVGQASQAARDYLHQYTQGFHLLNKQGAFQVLARGTPFATWAGDVGVAVGAHYRKDEVSQSLTRDSAQFPIGAFSFGNYAPFSAQRNVKELFGETNVPLVANVPFVKAVNLNLGYRYQNYSDDGAWNAWKVGFTWDVNDQVRLRATRSRDIRAPHLFQQYGTGGTSLLANLTDPRTGQTIVVNGAGLPQTNPSPNPGLRPETSDSVTAGIVLQPHWVSGMRLSLDYFRMKIGSVIVAVSSQQLINSCLGGTTDLCQFITFSGPGTTGSILATRNPNVNFNQLDVAGYNAEIDYDIPLHVLGGSWNVRGLATYMDRYNTVNNFTNVTLDEIGTGLAGQPRLQTNLLVTYKRGSFATTASWRYFRGLQYSSTFNGVRVGPDDPIYYSTVSSTAAAPCPGGAATCPWYQTAPNSISQNKFPGASYLNWSAQYDIGGSRLKNLQVYVKVDNVLDRSPPEYAFAAFQAGLFSIYDVIGRNYKLGFKASL